MIAMSDDKKLPHSGTKEFPAVKAEPVTEGTREFTAVPAEKAGPLYSLSRPSSSNAAAVCRMLQWFRADNTLLVVYLVFSLILAIFSVYYVLNREYILLILPGVAFLFMVYTIFRGHNVFCKGMNGDESKTACTLVTEFSDDSFTVSFGGKTETLPYSAVKDIRRKADYIYLQIKNSRHFSCGVLLLCGSFVENEADGFVEFIKAKIEKC